MDLQTLSDEELVLLAQKDNKNAMSFIIEKYKSVVKAVSRSYFLVGGDDEDLFQEGLIGLFNAIVSYNGKSSFKSYVYVCVKNNIVSVIRKYNNQKNLPMLNYVSLTGHANMESDKTDIVIDERISDPETEYINRESSEELKQKISNTLSNLENNILALYLQGFSYAEIALKTNKQVKSIDNAIQRIRKKVYDLIDKES